MKRKNTTSRPMRLSEETLQKLKQLKRELSALEKRDLSMGKIIDRVLSGEDVIERLRIGSRQRGLSGR